MQCLYLLSKLFQLIVVAWSSADCRNFSHLTDPCSVLRVSVLTRLRHWSACPCANERNLRTKTDIYSMLQRFRLTQIPCALAKSVSMLIGFRFVQGFFGSASIANGGGTISDMYDAIERTRVVGWYILGPLTGEICRRKTLL